MQIDIPNLTFLPDGSYDLSTPAALRNIGTTIPIAYRGPEFVRDQMARNANQLVEQLRASRRR